MALTHDHVQRSYVSKGDVLEDALACTCYGSIWAVESAADIPTMLCWHGTIAGSGISKKQTVALGPCGSWRTESYNEGVFPFQLHHHHHHHHHHHPVAALGSYADSWRATTSMNCCSWALRQLEDSKGSTPLSLLCGRSWILCG